MQLTKEQILDLFDRLNSELSRGDIRGELYLVGGAVMCLVHEARESTKDIDGYFRPARELRAAAKEISKEEGLDDSWLNDAVKGFLSEKGEFDSYLELSHLKVYTALPEYLLALKCLAMRIGEEFYDLDDVRYLLRSLNITDYQSALDLITSYYPIERFPQKTLYALEELIPLE